MCIQRQRRPGHQSQATTAKGGTFVPIHYLRPTKFEKFWVVIATPGLQAQEQTRTIGRKSTDASIQDARVLGNRGALLCAPKQNKTIKRLKA